MARLYIIFRDLSLTVTKYIKKYINLCMQYYIYAKKICKCDVKNLKFT